MSYVLHDINKYFLLNFKMQKYLISSYSKRALPVSPKINLFRLAPVPTHFAQTKITFDFRFFFHFDP